MIKKAYKKELVIKTTQRKNGTTNNRKDVRKIQSWLSLYAIQNPHSGTATAIDGDFGPATDGAVKNFQMARNVAVNGIVDHGLFSLLSGNMLDAFETPLQETTLRDLVIEAAENHLKNFAFELQINGASNSGPWVRAYMDGHDGSPWYWCMGFVQTIIDQAASSVGKSFKKLMPLTYSCDTVGTVGVQKNLLTRYRVIRQHPEIIEPGDIFLIQKSLNDWIHTGIITAIDGDVIETIEGNTNQAGSRNGIAVMKRNRNFRKSKIDVFSIAPLVNA
ncbi:peptidoglycan-binding domain-containing protein [Seonamhaeicola sp.]|uniref:peptidoglycan-binding domain-containing protein n=1 Tax=Seonamhaeicola sp. TaxID=1912245 RepID=UPI002609B249|nr:peptidoglycan-binding domain-containing protein [Seonamhaeicola sp.]